MSQPRCIPPSGGAGRNNRHTVLHESSVCAIFTKVHSLREKPMSEIGNEEARLEKPQIEWLFLSARCKHLRCREKMGIISPRIKIQVIQSCSAQLPTALFFGPCSRIRSAGLGSSPALI